MVHGEVVELGDDCNRPNAAHIMTSVKSSVHGVHVLV
jgi:hypothetical protein